MRQNNHYGALSWPCVTERFPLRIRRISREDRDQRSSHCATAGPEWANSLLIIFGW
jgi:hypothetical protein